MAMTPGSPMDPQKTETHSFVVKIELEDEGSPLLRGHITHVSTGERRYFDDLAEIRAFISERLGLRPGLRRRLLGMLRLDRR